jgi:hypothetical protein
MANPTYQLIQAQTLGSAASSVTFSNISQTYTDLKLLTSVRSNANDTSFWITFNGTSTGYYKKDIYTYVAAPTAGTLGSSSQSNAAYTDIDALVVSVYTGNTFNNGEIIIPNYTSSNYKAFSSSMVAENNAAQNPLWMVAGMWANTAPITSIGFTTNSNSFVTNSTFYLYGIRNY